MALSASNLTAGLSNSNPGVTASVAPTSGSLTLLWVAYAVAGGGSTLSGDTVAPTGARGTWTELLRLSSGDDADVGRRAIVLFAGSGSVTSETISISVTTLGGTYAEVAWCVDEWTGQDTTTPYGTAVRNAASGTTGLLPTVGTPGTDARVTAAWLHETSEVVTATGFTALGSVTGGTDVRTLHSFYDASDPQDDTPEASWATSSTWGGIGIIVNALAGGGGSSTQHLKFNLLGVG